MYEAMQVNLGRRVALKLLPAHDELREVRTVDWPEHPRVVRLYATGPWEGGRFVAMQLVPGPTLARLLETGTPDPCPRLELLADVAAALDAAHRAGIAHGGVTARNVFVAAHGHALLSDFGLAARAPSVADDRIDFAVLMRDCLGDRLPPLPDPRSTEASELVRLARAALPAPRPEARGGAATGRRAIAAAAFVGVVAAAALAMLLLGGSNEEGDPVPRPLEGARALGSDLAAGATNSVDCNGQPPSGASQACTVVQTRLAGRALVPPGPGAIRRWAVRGARGELALQMIRARGDGYVSVARTRYELVADKGVHVLPANLSVRTGDRVGVQLAPGAAIGVRPGVPGATTARWLGQLFLEPRPIELGAGSGFDHELLLRVEYTPGPTPAVPGALSGRSARRAPAGRELSSRAFEVRGRVRRVTVVRLANAVAVDLFAGNRRLARLPAPDADPAGRLLNFGTLGIRSPILRWRNPDGRTVRHEYAVGVRKLRARS
ncbi:MAG: serine/threonine kinase PknH [Thermoleophilaceae bacterium]|nr:serine/threonine kinase PknH [Thermoleophilaceae bacterium]